MVTGKDRQRDRATMISDCGWGVGVGGESTVGNCSLEEILDCL